MNQAQAEAKQQAQAQYGAALCADQQGYSPQESLVQQIGRRINSENGNLSNLYRAQDILQRHPEFEDLTWLIRSGLV
jgi:hypothetical protein